jgi:hypothetical protein
MKIANLIVSHKNPRQLQRLLSQYSGAEFENWVHIDSRIDLEPYRIIFQQKNVKMLRRRKVVWAGNSFVKVVLDSFSQILQNREVGYISVMSGLDFPVKPVEEFYERVYKSFDTVKEEFFDICALEDWPYNQKPISDRFERYHLSDWTGRGRYFTERIINSILPKRKFYGGKLVPYGRSAWFTASHEFCSYALDYFRNNPGYLRFLQGVWASDEFAFSSLVMNSHFKDKRGPNHLRFIDWSEKKASPRTFTIEQYDQVIGSGCYIARKFDEQVDSMILDKLEAHLQSEKISVPKPVS